LLIDAEYILVDACNALKNDHKDHLDEWNRLGEIYSDLKEFQKSL
jgi:hypothetical protein